MHTGWFFHHWSLNWCWPSGRDLDFELEGRGFEFRPCTNRINTCLKNSEVKHHEETSQFILESGDGLVTCTYVMLYSVKYGQVHFVMYWRAFDYPFTHLKGSESLEILEADCLTAGQRPPLIPSNCHGLVPVRPTPCQWRRVHNAVSLRQDRLSSRF